MGKFISLGKQLQIKKITKKDKLEQIKYKNKNPPKSTQEHFEFLASKKEKKIFVPKIVETCYSK